MAFCNNCGAQLPEDKKFCGSCGQPVTVGVAPQQQQQSTSQPQYQQQPQPQYPPPYPQQPEYPPPVPPKNGSSKKILIPIIAVVTIAIIAVTLVLVFTAGNKFEKMDFFEIGGDQVPSVMYVLGETRKITDATVSASSKAEKMVVAYEVEKNQSAEMEEYAEVLMDDYDFLSVNEYDFSGTRGKNFQFAKESDEDDDYIIVVRIDYTTSGYTLTITRGKGTLTVHDPVDPVGPTPTQPVEPTPTQPEEPTPTQPEEPTPTQPEEPKAEVELIVPGILAGESLEQAQANAPAGVTVTGPSSDGSFLYSMSKDTQQQLLTRVLQETEDLIMDIFYDVPGINDIRWNPDDFSIIYIEINDEFLSEANQQSSLEAILALGLKAPMVQIYQGKGMATETLIGWGDESMENVAGTVYSPSFLYEWLG